MSVDFIEPVPASAISPSEAEKRHLGFTIPGEVYMVFNKILSYRFSSSIRIKRKEVIEKIIEEMGRDVTAEYIFRQHWLDIEQSYRDNGWLVERYFPIDDKLFDAYWIFSVPKK